MAVDAKELKKALGIADDEDVEIINIPPKKSVGADPVQIPLEPWADLQADGSLKVKQVASQPKGAKDIEGLGAKIESIDFKKMKDITGPLLTAEVSLPKGLVSKKKPSLSLKDVQQLHEQLKIAEGTYVKLGKGIEQLKDVIKNSLITVEYSTNNSGGHWWLTDKDWLLLEKAGWKVQWGHHGHIVDSFDKVSVVERFMGASAQYATLECIHLNQAIASWKSVVGQDPEEEGCSCCGQPHNFYIVKKK